MAATRESLARQHRSHPRRFSPQLRQEFLLDGHPKLREHLGALLRPHVLHPGSCPALLRTGQGRVRKPQVPVGKDQLFLPTRR